ncbi:DUF4233 domain-containing protein [Leekyejoonella antrihumi]|uniref:DUF4233 domain-containing protein n=1 Tax=Leekyejoonella antrihumi TaxID=1660198 RepID=A0A563E564_9MICO|nr:DUF4233 domain-containing protein [Leekyejoonella antrihumi]TWP37646.1 DUF4233 domain-containing protein [Leekyejoonella antrihumi]
MIGSLLLYGVGERMTRRFAALVIGSQSLVVFFGALVAYALAKAQGQAAHTAYLTVGIVLALLCIMAAGTLRRPWGVALGWSIEIATLISAVVVPMMFVVGLIFIALWATALVQGRKMDDMTKNFTAHDPG